MTLALDGVKVIDVSQGVPGPLCAMVLGDLGADVIKVEPPSGDWLREVGPFVGDESALFLQLNRNKKGISLDLKSEADRAIFRDLVASADVLIEGYRPGVMDRLGLGYEAVEKTNPRLVYCSISGYGSKGPMADLPATEVDIQAFTGKNRQLGRPTDPPVRVGYDVVCANAAWAAAQGIIASLLWRERTGEGQKVETSLLDAAIMLLQWTTAAESNPDEWHHRPLSGYAEPPDHGFASNDGNFLFDMGRVEEEWEQLCQLLEADHLLEDPRFVDFRHRQRNSVALKEALEPILSGWSFEDLRAVIQDGLGGSIVPMHTLESLSTNEQIEVLGAIGELPHPGLGTYRTLTPPWHFSEPIVRLAPDPAPALDEHREAILAQAGEPSAAR
jgi:crotonobetainyl-CoA:carnitine CoA-transferase CaiB-like acyl-CoA transferase